MYDILFQGANINLDLVNFDEPVTIQELRIIPLGAQIEINPGGLRLGATNPMTFHLEAYAADVKSNKKLSTFQKIGRLVSPTWLKIGSIITNICYHRMLMNFVCFKHWYCI